MTADKPKCLSCKNYTGSMLCKQYGECLKKVFVLGEKCKKYEKVKQ